MQKILKAATIFVKVLIGIYIIWMFSVFVEQIVLMFNLNVKAFEAEYDSEDKSFWYEGKKYWRIDESSLGDLVFYAQKDRCIGRISGTALVVYELRNNPDNSVLMCEGVDAVYTYSDRYGVVPDETKITGVHLWSDDCIDYDINEYTYLDRKIEINMFQNIWDNRTKGKRKYFDEETRDELPNLLFMLCHDGCTVPREAEQERLIYYNGKWYYQETNYIYSNNIVDTNYYGYCIENDEIQMFLNQFLVE